jgi:DNA-binding NtrC family response regulator
MWYVSRTALAAESIHISQSLRLLPARPGAEASPVLLAGADSVQRTAVRHELASTLPGGTCFEEASAFWEVLARSPECRMVIFSGDLEDGAAESYMQTLKQRHPELPAVSLKIPQPDAL